MSSLDHRTANKQADRKIVTFSLGHQTFGIDMHSLIEIREWEEPTPRRTVFVRYSTSYASWSPGLAPIAEHRDKLWPEVAELQSTAGFQHRKDVVKRILNDLGEGE